MGCSCVMRGHPFLIERGYIMETSEKVKDMSFKVYLVRSQRLAGNLMTKGFVLLGMEPDRNYPSRNIFKFSNSEPLRNAIEEYKQIKSK